MRARSTARDGHGGHRARHRRREGPSRRDADGVGLVEPAAGCHERARRRVHEGEPGHRDQARAPAVQLVLHAAAHRGRDAQGPRRVRGLCDAVHVRLPQRHAAADQVPDGRTEEGSGRLGRPEREPERERHAVRDAVDRPGHQHVLQQGAVQEGRPRPERAAEDVGAVPGRLCRAQEGGHHPDHGGLEGRVLRGVVGRRARGAVHDSRPARLVRASTRTGSRLRSRSPSRA